MSHAPTERHAGINASAPPVVTNMGSRRHPPLAGREDSEAGYSIVEALVALFVFALAAVGLVQLQATSIGAFTRVEERTLAGLVAQNTLTEAMAAAQAPAIGVREGEAEMAGRAWRWRQEITATADARVRRVSVRVLNPSGRAAAEAHGFRAASSGNAP